MTVTPLRQQASEEATPSSLEDVSTNQKPMRGRSTIEFPYADLDDATCVAKAIRDKGGVPLAKDQLAAAMGQPVTSGAFTAKLHAARMFGLVEFTLGKIRVTDLGFEAVEGDDGRARAAKARAFLNVPLFARAYQEFRNRQLPPRPTGLEQAFVSFGVIETRSVNARWAFDRSARQAGFFESGDTRLVEPVIANDTPSRPVQEVELPSAMEDEPVVKSPSKAASDPLIQGLMARMPPAESKWPLPERAKWLKAFAVNLAMIYGHDDDKEIEVRVPSPAANLIAKVKSTAEQSGSGQATQVDELSNAPVTTIARVRTRPPAAPQSPAPTTQWEPAGGDLDDEIPF